MRQSYEVASHHIDSIEKLAWNSWVPASSIRYSSTPRHGVPRCSTDATAAAVPITTAVIVSQTWTWTKKSEVSPRCIGQFIAILQLG